MAPQHVEIAETIAALRKTLRREKEAPTNQPITSATNRGNKLKRGANYVHMGALPYPHGPDGYKQKIEHAGYPRYVLDRNPKRYNEYGDELEDSESDAEADADADDENPYTGIRIEDLLCPLKHPAELATHPTLSLPFLDSALPDMVKTTEDKLRQERANLWRAKNLSRHFMGDESWMPCGSAEVSDDWDLFDPKPNAPLQQAGKKRKHENGNEVSQNGINGHDSLQEEDSPTQNVGKMPEANNEAPEGTQIKKIGKDEAADPSTEQPPKKDKIDKIDKIVAANEPPATNGVHLEQGTETAHGESANEQLDENHPRTAAGEPSEKVDVDGEEPDDDTASDAQPQPTRRITRALAAEYISSTAPTPPLSPHSTTPSIDSSLLQADPIFLLPPALAAKHRAPRSLSRLGLPAEEFMETRRLLTMFIQKQEESVRGYEAVLAKLIKAKRMRDNVWEWSKTEGHVGEWSDGEDWVDAEAWGLTADELKKGKDEEEVEGQEDTGRKGKRRRRD